MYHSFLRRLMKKISKTKKWTYCVFDLRGRVPKNHSPTQRLLLYNVWDLNSRLRYHFAFLARFSDFTRGNDFLLNVYWHIMVIGCIELTRVYCEN